MYLTIKQEPRISKDELLVLKELSHIAKNLYNEALYNIRQYFFNNGSYINYYNNYKELKNSIRNANKYSHFFISPKPENHQVFSLMDEWLFVL